LLARAANSPKARAPGTCCVSCHRVNGAYQGKPWLRGLKDACQHSPECRQPTNMSPGHNEQSSLLNVATARLVQPEKKKANALCACFQLCPVRVSAWRPELPGAGVAPCQMPICKVQRGVRGNRGEARGGAPGTGAPTRRRAHREGAAGLRSLPMRRTRSVSVRAA